MRCPNSLSFLAPLCVVWFYPSFCTRGSHLVIVILNPSPILEYMCDVVSRTSRLAHVRNESAQLNSPSTALSALYPHCLSSYTHLFLSKPIASIAATASSDGPPAPLPPAAAAGAALGNGSFKFASSMCAKSQDAAASAFALST